MNIESKNDNCLIIHSHSPDNTQYIGHILGETLERGSVIELNGNLGAGKTVFVKGIASGIGLEDEPASPTFVILSIYDGKIPLYHFDLYRLSKLEELDDIDYKDYFYGDGISVVEWAEKIPEAFPDNAIRINITAPMENNNETDRIITVKGEKKWLLSFKNMVERALQASKK